MRTMRFIHLLLPFTCAASLQAQGTERPTCAELGTPRHAVMAPPGADEDQVRRQLLASGAVAAGSEVHFIDRREAPPMQDLGGAERQLGLLLFRLDWQGMRVEGEAVSIVSLDETGAIQNVVPGSGNADVDRVLRTFWRRRQFAPPIVEGCRAPAWVRVPIQFRVFDDKVEVRVEYPAMRERREEG